MPGFSRRAVLAVCLILSAATAAPAAAAVCASGAEAEALRVRSLQNRLMVAALTCGEQQRYNAFIGRFDAALAERGRVMMGYFERRHQGKRVKRVVDDYVTTQANGFSLSSMQNRPAFCREAAETLSTLLQGDVGTLVAHAATVPASTIDGPLACLREAQG